MRKEKIRLAILQYAQIKKNLKAESCSYENVDLYIKALKDEYPLAIIKIREINKYDSHSLLGYHFIEVDHGDTFYKNELKIIEDS